MMISLTMLLLLFIGVAKASPEQGQLEAELLLQDATINSLTTSPNYQKGQQLVENMKYEREQEKHARWQQNQNVKSENLEKQGTAQATTETIGKQIINADKNRPRFDEIINLKLIAESEQYSKNAEQELIKDGVRKRMTVDPNFSYEIKLCQHSRQPEKHQCIKYLNNPKITVIPERTEKKSNHLGCMKHYHSGNITYIDIFNNGHYEVAKLSFPDGGNRYQGICLAHWTITHPKQVIEQENSSWVSECHTLESRKSKNECKIIKEECLDNNPRIINGETIHKPCWKYQYTYECKYPVQVSCEPLLSQGCSPLDSKCIFSVANQDDPKCYIWEQKYQCPINQKKVKSISKYIRPFCLEGECFNTDYAPNNEMLPAIAQLDIFRQMQNDVRVSINSIFKGSAQGCNKLCVGVKNCCKVSGWGIDIGLADCSPEEKQLADNRRKGLCIEVGTYCAEKMPLTKICIRKKTNFCCFSSKLTKAVQAQGRNQLGINFGDAENPNCRGLTPEELSRIDFSRLDLTEAFSDLQPKLKDPSQLQQKLQQRMQEIQADFTIQTRGEK